MSHDQELVSDDNDTDLSERRGEMLGTGIREGIEMAAPGLAAYGAARSDLPTVVRIGFAAVAVTGAPKALGMVRDKIKRWLRKE